MGQRKTTTPSVGTQLHEARQRQGWTLEEASRTLHIPLKQLQALEGDTGAGTFAAPVYAYGALRSYATWLGINSQPLERLLVAQFKAADVGRSRLEVHTLPRWYEWMVTPRTIIAAAIALVGITVGSYVVWQIRSFWRLPYVAITEPVEAIINSDQVTIIGQTEDGARIRINGQPATLKENAYFEQIIPLDPGITFVRVESENVAGRVRVVEKQLLRPRDASMLK